MTPERRVYTASGTPTTEAAIETYGFSQLYLQLGEQGADGSRVVRAWFKPYVTLVWLGAVVMALAGFLSLTDRRLRVGVPKRAATPTRSRRRPNEGVPRGAGVAVAGAAGLGRQSERDAERSGARGAGAGDLDRAPLPRLPERVDRRQRRRSGARNPSHGAAAADRGRLDDQVRQYLVDRYGEFVLLKPVMAWHTLVLWIAAPTILVVGGIVLIVAARRRKSPVSGEAALTADEQKALDELR